MVDASVNNRIIWHFQTNDFIYSCLILEEENFFPENFFSCFERVLFIYFPTLLSRLAVNSNKKGLCQILLKPLTNFLKKHKIDI